MMTTPEALRHRQYRLGFAIMILGILTVVWGIVLETQNVNQRHCLRTSLEQLNNSFTVRASLNDQRNEVLTEKATLLDQQVAAQRTLIVAVSASTTRVDLAKAFTQFAKTDKNLATESLNVTKHLAELNAKLKSTKVPDFPAGKCS